MMHEMDPKDFDKVYALMEESFPRDERRDYEGQKKLLSNPKYTVFVLPYDEKDQIKAFITVYRFDDFAFAEHFAVDPRSRSQGLGSAILEELKKRLPCRICLEAELPETKIAKRRIGFYERNGFYQNPYPYTQPPYSADRKSVPLRIMTTGRPLSKPEFLHIQSLLYREVYHVNG